MTTVFTNGCFDIVHAGHIMLLEYARSFGDKLVVAVNSDASVRRLKGCGRPINRCDDRVAVLRAIRAVDDVYVFDSDTPEDIICEIQPDVLVKGPEARNTEIPGAKWVLARGGRVIVPDWKINVSTTDICRKVSSQCKCQSINSDSINGETWQI